MIASQATAESKIADMEKERERERESSQWQKRDKVISMVNTLVVRENRMTVVES